MNETIDAGVDYGDTLAFARRTALSFTTSTAAIRYLGETHYRLNGSARLTRGFGRTWSSWVGYNRDTEFRIGFSAPLLSDSIDAGLAGQFSWRAKWSTGVGYTNGTIGFGSDRFHTYSATSRLDFALNRMLAVFGQYGHYHYEVPPGSSTLNLVPRFSRQTVVIGLSAVRAAHPRRSRSEGALIAMIPGKQYTPEIVLQIAWRHKWRIVVPFVVIATAASLITYRLPNRYRSDTLILVVPQRVPESYVRSTVTTRIEDRLQSISQQILSRTRLERIIQDFNLYADRRKTDLMEDIVERMRKDIDLEVVKGDAFRVSFTASDPRTAMRVTERLASFFIDESLRDREVLAEGTNQFLESQLEDARRQLIENEKKLEEYRRKHDGQLPTQLDANMQGVHNTEMQLQALLDSLNRDRDRRLVLERLVADNSSARHAGHARHPASGPTTRRPPGRPPSSSVSPS